MGLLGGYIQKDIIAIQQVMMEVAKISDIQKVSTQIASVKEDIDFQMSDIKKVVSESSSSRQYLEPNTVL